MRAVRATFLVLCLVVMGCSGDDGDDGDDAATTTDAAEDTSTTEAPATTTTEPEVEVFDAVDLASGDQHACALDPDGAAWCWGYNHQGQLGDGTGETSSSPVAVATDETFVQLTSGRYFSCGLTDEGSVHCWGDNSSGQLGNGENGGGSADANQLAPVQVSTDVAFASIVSGQLHTCGLTSGGEAWCWGAYASGQLGNGAGEAQSTPVRSAEGLTFDVLAFGGDVHTCGVSVAGEAWCWGSNAFGQLGDGTQTNARQPEPRQVTGGHVFSSVTLGKSHTCAIDADGIAWCWGSNTFGQTGTPASEDDVVAPAAVETDLRFESITANDQATCAVTDDGAAYCWGRNVDGRLGTGDDVDTHTPTPVAGDLTFEIVSAGETFACGLTTDGEVWCWGANGSGWLGTGGDDPSEVPVPVAPAG